MYKVPKKYRAANGTLYFLKLVILLSALSKARSQNRQHVQFPAIAWEDEL